jgi:tetratricopeptide (TPR) repeat protein
LSPGLVALLVAAHVALASPWSVATPHATVDAPGGLRRGAPAVDDSADASRREAAAAFADGEAAFDRGDYAVAAERFERAHALLPHAWTLYNLALSRARAGDARGAWHAFDELGERAPTEEERREARAERDALLPLLAVVRVRGEPSGRACIDGVEVPLDKRGRAQRVLDPGAHRLAGPKGERTIELAAGTSTELDAATGPRARSPARAWLVVATVFSGVALGGSIGAAATSEDRLVRGLSGAAAGASAVALAGSIAALVLVQRRAAKTAAFTCADVRTDR